MVPVIFAAWVAVSVFVVWVLVSRSAIHWWERRSAKASATELPPPTPEELMEAQSLGLMPKRPNPTEPSKWGGR